MNSANHAVAADCEALVAEVADQFTNEIKHGNSPSVEAYAERHPEIAGIIRQVFPSLALLNDCSTMKLQEEQEGEPVTGVLGDFRIVRELGRGGMGVVYEAEQILLGRRVALKVLPYAAMLDKQQLARFKNEARAAATLEHANIVAIYSVGCERGVHYYAMQLVEGRSLAEIIAAMKSGHLPSARETAPMAALPPAPVVADTVKSALPTVNDRGSAVFSSIPGYASDAYYRWVAQLGVETAEALDHAHQNGILHRDIKPANLLVDEAGKLWVTDFGLARIEQGDGLTLTGDILGTLRYMSPEQTFAKRAVVDHRTDIYSLGVTLYELLTQQPAFTGDDRHELLRQIALDEASKPRQVNSQIPHDLETIILKSIEKSPADRYATAQELADDLHCFLDHESIAAKPASGIQRMRKWMQRHPAIVWPTVAALSVVTIVSMASAFLLAGAYAKESTARHEAQSEQVKAERERLRAEEHLRTARAAVDRIFTQVADDLRDAPHMEQIRRALLEDGLEFYQEFLREKNTDPDIRRETARAYYRVGSIYLLLGRNEQVVKPLHASIELLKKLAEEFPSVPEYRSELSDSHALLSRVLSDSLLSRPDVSLENALFALEIKRKLAAEFPNRPEFLRALAGYLPVVALRFSHGVMRPTEAEKYFREALESWKAIQKDAPDAPDTLANIALTRFWLGSLFLQTNRLPEAEAEIRPALAFNEQLLAHRPGDIGRRNNVAHQKAYLGDVFMRTGRCAEAEPLLREAIACRQATLDNYPDSYDIWRRLRMEYELLGQCQLAMGRMEEAEDAMRQHLSVSQKVTKDFTSEGQTSMDLAWSYYSLGLLLHATDRIPDAADAFRQSFGMIDKEIVEHPELAGYRNKLGWMLATCPAVQFRNSERAVELAKQALQRQPMAWQHWHLLGVAQYRSGDAREAIESLEKCMSLYNGGDGTQWFFLAMAHSRCGNQVKANDLYRRAVDWMQKNQRNTLDVRNFRAEAEELICLAEKQPTTASPQ